MKNKSQGTSKAEGKKLTKREVLSKLNVRTVEHMVNTLPHNGEHCPVCRLLIYELENL